LTLLSSYEIPPRVGRTHLAHRLRYDRTGAGFLGDFIPRSDSAFGPAAQIAKKLLAPIPTLFERLVFISSLRDPTTGRYTHPSLIEIGGSELADRTLRNTHHRVFQEWLGLNLPDQKSDLDDYLRTARISAAELRYRELAPASAHEVEVQLYLTDLEVLLQLLSFEQRGAFALPESSPHR